jgi:hypothetical protein
MCAFLMKYTANLAMGVGYFATLLKDVRYETLAVFVNVRPM